MSTTAVFGRHGFGAVTHLMVTALILAVGAVAPGHAQTSAGDGDPTPHSDARLVAEAATVGPGEPFTLGVHITLDDGWHTYWLNAGDAGNGTIMEWDLPAGFTVDSLRYPVPERIPYPPLMNYGYHDEVVLLTTVTPPASLSGDRVPIRATADFLVCAEICVPATAELELMLPVASADGAERGEDGTAADGEGRGSGVAGSPDGHVQPELVSRFRNLLPLESHDWSFRAARTDSGFVLAGHPPAGWEGSLDGAYFFPYDAMTLSHVAEQDVGLAGEELRLTLTASEYLMDEPDALEGIVVLPEGSAFDEAGHRGLEVRAPVETEDVAWADAPTTPLASAPEGKPVSLDGDAAGANGAAGA
ncbi:MAG: protein-disulfide reductase DsbD domain-containing protein, partial [Gemmatimonadota bacterium]